MKVKWDPRKVGVRNRAQSWLMHMPFCWLVKREIPAMTYSVLPIGGTIELSLLLFYLCITVLPTTHTHTQKKHPSSGCTIKSQQVSWKTISAQPPLRSCPWSSPSQRNASFCHEDPCDLRAIKFPSPRGQSISQWTHRVARRGDRKQGKQTGNVMVDPLAIEHS